VNASQPMVVRHLVDTECPQSNTQACNINEAGTSENFGSLVLGNHEPQGIDCSTTIVNTCFSTIITNNFINNPEPNTMVECMKHSDWSKWKEAIEDELNSLKKRKVFTDVISTPCRIFPVGFKWVFIQKRNENNEVIRYKMRLVAQGFT
jgi:hypothetical protein